MPDDAYPLPLLRHPATPAPALRALEARATLGADGALTLAYRLWGDMARILVAPQQSPARADSLWEHTCFEAFVGLPDQTAYREYNFSPSGQWAAYAFSSYRQRDERLVIDAAPRITTQRFAGRLEVAATIPAAALPPGADRFSLGLCAVVEATDVVDGCHSYWALAHPAARPDFHLRAAFTLRVARDSV